jgi:hypothetical protein
VTKEYFKVDTSEKAKVKIALLLADFSTHFLPKVEEGSLPGELIHSSKHAPHRR